jgi:UDP-N-acetylmuramyl pentapeptide phosphotransferase/UDP-N-acetylglucosamine-1-phosphate transferase
MIQILLGGAFSLVITLLFLPILIRFAESKEFYVPRTFRRIHDGKVSALGGIAIFLATFISILLFSDFIDFVENRYLLAAGILLFFIGLRDDLKEISALAKLIVQILVAAIVVFLAGYQIDEFMFFDNFIHLEQPWSGILTIVFILLIINAFNFIDGIDLQATLVALVVMTPFGLWFFLNNQLDMGLLLVSLGMSLLGFAIYNYSPAKIFMGDMGTMIIGLIISISFIRFSQLHETGVVLYQLKNPYLFTITTFLIPISDLIRVSATRILKGTSPLKGDKNHIHHWLLRLGWSQNKIAFFIATFSLFIIVFNFVLQTTHVNSYITLLVNVVIIVFFYLLIFFQIKKR